MCIKPFSHNGFVLNCSVFRVMCPCTGFSKYHVSPSLLVQKYFMDNSEYIRSYFTAQTYHCNLRKLHLFLKLFFFFFLLVCCQLLWSYLYFCIKILLWVLLCCIGELLMAHLNCDNKYICFEIDRLLIRLIDWFASVIVGLVGFHIELCPVLNL